MTLTRTCKIKLFHHIYVCQIQVKQSKNKEKRLCDRLGKRLKNKCRDDEIHEHSFRQDYRKRSC